ncbi:hypothetical protein, partial [Desulforegula conservatrix]|uniref:hypothetical protein n=1 Tax=Desulforegula conservatrix TaxID=153026 RepID=UPI001E46406E
LNFRRFSYWRLLLIPGSVKLCESTGRAGGLLMINYSNFSIQLEHGLSKRLSLASILIAK